MLIKFFRNGQGRGAGPVGYLTAVSVLAYDDNRDLIREADGTPKTVIRDPMPQVLRGDPERTEALIDACPHKWAYRSGVISFAQSDAPDEAQQAQVIDAFEEIAFAGLDPEQYDCLWVRHTHEDRVELHFCTVRMELTTGKSLNIAPPGYEAAFDSLRDLMNKTHDWADPMDAERVQEVRSIVEGTQRVHGRDELHAWVLDQISIGLVTDRPTMIQALSEAGFALPRLSKNYITAQDPETGERWRLKGDIFDENWTAADASEREIEHRAGEYSTKSRRLDGVSVDELQDRFDGHCSKRAGYNRGRFECVLGAEQIDASRTIAGDQAVDNIRTLDGDGLSDLVDRIVHDRKLSLDQTIVLHDCPSSNDLEQPR